MFFRPFIVTLIGFDIGSFWLTIIGISLFFGEEK